jgi:hypothetical protein
MTFFISDPPSWVDKLAAVGPGPGMPRRTLRPFAFIYLLLVKRWRIGSSGAARSLQSSLLRDSIRISRGKEEGLLSRRALLIPRSQLNPDRERVAFIPLPGQGTGFPSVPTGLG